jgi:hypothetical protein
MGRYAKLEKGPVAQRLEQQTHNLLVAGSNPAGPTTNRTINHLQFPKLPSLVFRLARQARFR